MIEQQIEESPELCMVPRLSVFEDICPSEGILSDTKGNQFKQEQNHSTPNIDLFNGFKSPVAAADRTKENRVEFEK